MLPAPPPTPPLLPSTFTHLSLIIRVSDTTGEWRKRFFRKRKLQHKICDSYSSEFSNKNSFLSNEHRY